MFKSIGKRIMGALSGIATRGEVKVIDDAISEAAARARAAQRPDQHLVDASFTGTSVEETRPGDGLRRQKQRSKRNRKFHAKRGGAQQYGTVAHDLANNKVYQFFYNPMLSALLYKEGHMGVEYKG